MPPSSRCFLPPHSEPNHSRHGPHRSRGHCPPHAMRRCSGGRRHCLVILAQGQAPHPPWNLAIDVVLYASVAAICLLVSPLRPSPTTSEVASSILPMSSSTFPLPHYSYVSSSRSPHLGRNRRPPWSKDSSVRAPLPIWPRAPLPIWTRPRMHRPRPSRYSRCALDHPSTRPTACASARPCSALPSELYCAATVAASAPACHHSHPLASH